MISGMDGAKIPIPTHPNPINIKYVSSGKNRLLGPIKNILTDVINIDTAVTVRLLSF